MSNEEISEEISAFYQEKAHKPINKIFQEMDEKFLIIHENFIYLQSYKHYFSKSIEKNIELLLKSTIKIMEGFKERKYPKKEFDNYLESMEVHITEIIDEIRNNLLN